MKIRYIGPCDRVNVAPYGEHRQDEVREYPDDFAANLLKTSVRQVFEVVETEPPEAETPQVSGLSPQPSEGLSPQPSEPSKRKGRKG